jgi:hypothetical protein
VTRAVRSLSFGELAEAAALERYRRDAGAELNPFEPLEVHAGRLIVTVYGIGGRVVVAYDFEVDSIGRVRLSRRA